MNRCRSRRRPGTRSRISTGDLTAETAPRASSASAWGGPQIPPDDAWRQARVSLTGITADRATADTTSASRRPCTARPSTRARS
jgi:hypothetical protein